MSDRLWGQEGISECLGTISPFFSISRMKISNVPWLESRSTGVSAFTPLTTFSGHPTVSFNSAKNSCLFFFYFQE